MQWNGIVFDAKHWTFEHGKLPNITRFNGMSEQYKGWRMQIENFLALISPHWLPLLHEVTKQETTIDSNNNQTITMWIPCARLGNHLQQLVGPALPHVD